MLVHACKLRDCREFHQQRSSRRLPVSLHPPILLQSYIILGRFRLNLICFRRFVGIGIFCFAVLGLWGANQTHGQGTKQILGLFIVILLVISQEIARPFYLPLFQQVKFPCVRLKRARRLIWNLQVMIVIEIVILASIIAWVDEISKASTDTGEQFGSSIVKDTTQIEEEVSKVMNFGLKTRNCVSRTRNFVFKMMNFAG